MNIVILGAGSIGSYLATLLANEGNSVTVIDKDLKKLDKINQTADVATLHGQGTNWQLLAELSENCPSVFIAMTGDDETNLVACSIAKNLGYPKTIARVKDIGFLTRSKLDFGRLFYVDHFIGAEVLAANDILKLIINPQDIAIENFAHGSIQMRTFTVPKSWSKAKIPLSKLSLPQESIIGLIRRRQFKLDPKMTNDVLIFPHGSDHIEPSDEVTIIGETKFMKEIHDCFEIKEKNVKQATIIGGTAVGFRLAHSLEQRHIGVKLIERDEKKCLELAELLPHSTILNHDGSDMQFFEAENLQESDVIVACTNEDESNLLISLVAKQMGCKKIICLISDISYAPILKSLEINFSVSERVNIASRIHSIIHADKIVSIASLYNNRAKISEIKVSPDSEIVGIPISELKLPPNLIITAIENKGKIMIGKGSRIISPKDTIIVISESELTPELEKIF
ncbi:MAG: Trk system potassium transporter TrkA [Chlamydiae bacterium]|nr:Trk system potassium transporter TrkA [Chlamydiota bacterium]